MSYPPLQEYVVPVGGLRVLTDVSEVPIYMQLLPYQWLSWCSRGLNWCIPVVYIFLVCIDNPNTHSPSHHLNSSDNCMTSHTARPTNRQHLLRIILGQYSGCSDVRNTITDRVHTRLRQPNMTRGRCNCKSLINLDILKEHMGSDNGPKALLYISNTLA